MEKFVFIFIVLILLKKEDEKNFLCLLSEWAMGKRRHRHGSSRTYANTRTYASIENYYSELYIWSDEWMSKAVFLSVFSDCHQIHKNKAESITILHPRAHQ